MENGGKLKKKNEWNAAKNFWKQINIQSRKTEVFHHSLTTQERMREEGSQEISFIKRTIEPAYQDLKRLRWDKTQKTARHKMRALIRQLRRSRGNEMDWKYKVPVETLGRRRKAHRS